MAHSGACVLVMQDGRLLGLLSSENLSQFLFVAQRRSATRGKLGHAQALPTFFAFCFLASAENVKLYLKDGSYQLVREYQLEDDRVRFYSLDRDEWEEVPAALVDLDKTKAEIKARADAIRADAAAQDAEDKAERAARREVKNVPAEPGVYLIDDQKPELDNLTALKVGESKVVTNKRRSMLKAISPVPLVPGKATLELDGPHSSQGTANRSPEFYIRLSEEERFGIVRMGEHKGNRVVEKLTIQPVIKETDAGAGLSGGISPASG